MAQHMPPQEGRATVPDRSLLIVEDEAPYRERLAVALTRRGFEVAAVAGAAEALERIAARPPAFAVVDLRLTDGSGLDVVDALARARPQARSVIVTGYGDVPTAVAAVRMGAVDYIAKPADADDIQAALIAPRDGKPRAPERPMSPAELRQRHIDHVYEIYGQNVSETARRLDMHRRTLQRILARR